MRIGSEASGMCLTEARCVSFVVWISQTKRCSRSSRPSRERSGSQKAARPSHAESQCCHRCNGCHYSPFSSYKFGVMGRQNVFIWKHWIDWTSTIAIAGNLNFHTIDEKLEKLEIKLLWDMSLSWTCVVAPLLQMDLRCWVLGWCWVPIVPPILMQPLWPHIAWLCVGLYRKII